MKKIYTLTIILMLLGIITRAQITITSDDMVQPADTIRSSVSFDFIQYDFTETGENHHWDFSGLSPFSQRIDSFVTVQETPVFFWPFFLKSANVVLEINDFEEIHELGDGEGWQFFNNTTSSFSDVGYGLILQEIPLPLKYDDPDVLYSFPLNYGDTDEGQAGLEFSFPDLGYISIERERQTEVDGWGTLETPFGNFEVLRLKSVVNEFDSIYIDSLSQGFPIYRNYTEYKWMGKEAGLPLLYVIDDDVFGASIIYQDSVRDLSVSVPELVAENNQAFALFPNPADGGIHIRFKQAINHAVHLHITDIAGRQLYTETLQGVPKKDFIHSITLNPRQFKSGLYILYVFENENKNVVKFMIHN